MSKTTHLYEFLARFGEDDGALKGYHVQTITKHFDDGSLIAAKVSGAMNVAQATAAGFPLSAVLAEINAQSVTQRDAALAAQAAAEAERDQERAAKEAAEKSASDRQAALDSLTQEKAAGDAAAAQAAQAAAESSSAAIAARDAEIAQLRAQIAILTTPAPAAPAEPA